MGNIQEHLDDVDFRSREQRQANRKETYIDWYNQLSECLLGHDDERLQGQLTMLSAILWHELTPNEYKKLTTSKTLTNTV